MNKNGKKVSEGLFGAPISIRCLLTCHMGLEISLYPWCLSFYSKNIPKASIFYPVA